MIIVDSSVWIAYFRNISIPATERLDQWLGLRPIAIFDLILAEVLQGTDTDREFDLVLAKLSPLPLIECGGSSTAIKAARNFRLLRGKGITIRKTIDTLIATRCIMDGLSLLHSDRDFEPFVAHLGLRSALE